MSVKFLVFRIKKPNCLYDSVATVLIWHEKDNFGSKITPRSLNVVHLVSGVASIAYINSNGFLFLWKLIYLHLLTLRGSAFPSHHFFNSHKSFCNERQSCKQLTFPNNLQSSAYRSSRLDSFVLISFIKKNKKKWRQYRSLWYPRCRRIFGWFKTTVFYK